MNSFETIAAIIAPGAACFIGIAIGSLLIGRKRPELRRIKVSEAFALSGAVFFTGSLVDDFVIANSHSGVKYSIAIGMGLAFLFFGRTKNKS